MVGDDDFIQENSRRIVVLAGELGLKTGSVRSNQGTWMLDFSHDDLQACFELAAGRPFVRVNCLLSIDGGLADWLGSRLDDLQQVCYHYGCCHLVTLHSGRITVSIALTLYFGGLQYYALKEAIDDLELAVKEIRHLLEPVIDPIEGGDYGHT